MSDVQRTTAQTPTQSGADSQLDFYVTYPGSNNPMDQNILSSVLKEELLAVQSISSLFLTLQSSYSPHPPTDPTNEQSNNLVEIELVNVQADQVYLLSGSNAL